MVTELVLDILQAPADILAHQANCQHTMGSGVAKVIRAEYPEAYDADVKQTKRGDSEKLGTCSVATVFNPNAHKNTRIKYIFNMYGQFYYGRDERHTDYEAYYRGLQFMRGKITNTNFVLAMPGKMGCLNAGGSWRVCREMIYDVFDSSPMGVLICYLERENRNPL